MIKVYQVKRPELVVEGAAPHQLFYQGELRKLLIAEIDSDKENLEVIWDCCNNSCWLDEDEDWRNMTSYERCGTEFNVKFTNNYEGYCNSDIIVEMDGKFHAAESVGWHETSSLEEASQYIKNHSWLCALHSESDYYPAGRELSIQELRNIKTEAEDKGYRAWFYRTIEEE